MSARDRRRPKRDMGIVKEKEKGELGGGKGQEVDRLLSHLWVGFKN